MPACHYHGVVSDDENAHESMLINNSIFSYTIAAMAYMHRQLRKYVNVHLSVKRNVLFLPQRAFIFNVCSSYEASFKDTSVHTMIPQQYWFIKSQSTKGSFVGVI